MKVPAYIVQNLETMEFLCPGEHYPVIETPHLSSAGVFYEYESALESAVEETDGNFYIFKFYKEEG